MLPERKIHVEYTQNDASSSMDTAQTECCECIVFMHVCVEWEHPAACYPVQQEYEWYPTE